MERKINTSKLLKLTNDCFDRMNTNIKNQSEQTGGGSLNLDSLVPYLVSRDINFVDRNTVVPSYILSTVLSPIKIKSKLTKLSILSTDDLKTINYVLKSKPSNYF
jgi:hypothetical protein